MMDASVTREGGSVKEGTEFLLPSYLAQDFPQADFTYKPSPGQFYIPARLITEELHHIKVIHKVKKNHLNKAKARKEVEIQMNTFFAKMLRTKNDMAKLDVQRLKSIRLKAGKRDHTLHSPRVAATGTDERFAGQKWEAKRFLSTRTREINKKNATEHDDDVNVFLASCGPSDDAKPKIEYVKEVEIKVQKQFATVIQCCNYIQECLHQVMMFRASKFWLDHLPELECLQRKVKYVVRKAMHMRRFQASRTIYQAIKRFHDAKRVRSVAIIADFLWVNKKHFLKIIKAYMYKIRKCQRIIRNFLACHRAKMTTLLSMRNLFDFRKQFIGNTYAIEHATQALLKLLRNVRRAHHVNVSLWKRQKIDKAMSFFREVDQLDVQVFLRNDHRDQPPPQFSQYKADARRPNFLFFSRPQLKSEVKEIFTKALIASQGHLRSWTQQRGAAADNGENAGVVLSHSALPTRPGSAQPSGSKSPRSRMAMSLLDTLTSPMGSPGARSMSPRPQSPIGALGMSDVGGVSSPERPHWGAPKSPDNSPRMRSARQAYVDPMRKFVQRSLMAFSLQIDDLKLPSSSPQPSAQGKKMKTKKS